MLLYYLILSLVLVVPASVWALYAWRPKPVPIEKRKIHPYARSAYQPIETPFDGVDLETDYANHARNCRVCRTD